MKKQLLVLGLVIGSCQLIYAQSATVLPLSSDFINTSSADDAYAVKGSVINGVGGLNATGVWGHNNSFGPNGVGVRGTHVQGGIGVYGESVYGTGIYARTSVGTAFSAFAVNGLGLSSVSDGNVAGRFEITNAGNGYPAVEIRTAGAGAGTTITKTNTDGAGPGLVVVKAKPYINGYSIDAHAELEVRHPTGYFGMTGLRIFNTDTNLNSWTFYTNNDDGGLFLFAKGEKRGTFNAATGAYTNPSDVRLKKNISNYAGTLKNLMKIDVKAYQLLNSDKTEVGLMAQQTLKYFPEIVYNNTNERGEQYYSMDYSRIGVLAIKAIQEQQTVIEKQQTTIQKQQKEINTLKEQVKAIDTLKSEVEELKKLMKSVKR